MDRLAGTQPLSITQRYCTSSLSPTAWRWIQREICMWRMQKVGAIFIFNTETREVEMIKNKEHAHFVRIIGLGHG